MKEIIASRMKPLRISTTASKIVWKCKLMASDSLSILEDRSLRISNFSNYVKNKDQLIAWELLQILKTDAASSKRLLAKQWDDLYIAVNKNNNEVYWTYLFVLPKKEYKSKQISSRHYQGDSKLTPEELAQYKNHIRRLANTPSNYQIDIWQFNISSHKWADDVMWYRNPEKVKARLSIKSEQKLKNIESFLNQ